MNALKDAWAWMADNRGPLAWFSAFIKGVRALIWLPLLYDVITYSPVTSWTYLRFYAYAFIAVVAWFIDTILDADGDEK